jgi:biopolymer transport protein ExbB
MFFDKLFETILVGGWVLIPIFFVGVWAFFLLLRSAYSLGGDLFRSSLEEPIVWFKNSLSTPLAPPKKIWYRPGFSYTLLQKMLSIKQDSPQFLREAFKIELIRSSQEMGQRLYFVGVLGSLAPLLGLLGTVDGMVQTFDTITRYGNSNPVLLSDGISEALLTTQSGLLIAFPIILLKNYFDDRIAFLRSGLERLGMRALAELEKQK